MVAGSGSMTKKAAANDESQGPRGKPERVFVEDDELLPEVVAEEAKDGPMNSVTGYGKMPHQDALQLRIEKSFFEVCIEEAEAANLSSRFREPPYDLSNIESLGEVTDTDEISPDKVRFSLDELQMSGLHRVLPTEIRDAQEMHTLLRAEGLDPKHKFRAKTKYGEVTVYSSNTFMIGKERSMPSQEASILYIVGDEGNVMIRLAYRNEQPQDRFGMPYGLPMEAILHLARGYNLPYHDSDSPKAEERLGVSPGQIKACIKELSTRIEPVVFTAVLEFGLDDRVAAQTLVQIYGRYDRHSRLGILRRFGDLEREHHHPYEVEWQPWFVNLRKRFHAAKDYYGG
jgi:hypothetical protein